MIRTFVHPVIWLGAAVALTSVAPAPAAGQDDDRRRRIAEALKRAETRSKPSERRSSRVQADRIRPQTRRPVFDRGARSRPEIRRPTIRRPEIRRPTIQRPTIQRPERRPVLDRPERRRDIGGTINRSARPALPSDLMEHRERSSAGSRVVEIRPELPSMSPDWKARPDSRPAPVRRDDDHRRAGRPHHRGWYPRGHRFYGHRHRFHRPFGHRHFHRFGGFRFHSGHWHFVIVLGSPHVHRHHRHYRHGGHAWWDGRHSSLRSWDGAYSRSAAIRSYDLRGVRCVELRLRTLEGDEHRVEIDPQRWNADDPGDLYAALWAQLEREGYLELEGLDGVLHVFPEGLLQEIQASACR